MWPSQTTGGNFATVTGQPVSQSTWFVSELYPLEEGASTPVESVLLCAIFARSSAVLRSIVIFFSAMRDVGSPRRALLKITPTA
jgi:hypothetical protein